MNSEARTQGMFDLLSRTDADGETADPEFDADADTAGPDDQDDEVAGAELEAEEGDTGDIRALQKRGRHSISLEEAKALQARARLRGKKAGQKKAIAQVKKNPVQAKLPPNMVPPQLGTKQLFDKWTRRGDPFVVRQDGH